MTDKLYLVRVWDNFHYMDDDEAYAHGYFATYEAALAAAKAIVDQSLVDCGVGSSNAEDWYQRYTMFGEDPAIFGPAGTPHFSAWAYAKRRVGDRFGQVLPGTELLAYLERRITVHDATGNRVGDIAIGETPIGVRIRRSRFNGLKPDRTRCCIDFDKPASKEQADEVAGAAEARRWREVDRFHPGMLPWYCPACDRIYPEDRWTIRRQYDEDDDDWFYSWRAKCPHGHERQVSACSRATGGAPHGS